MKPTPTPQERLVILSLAHQPNQSEQELSASTGAKAPGYLRRTLHLLVLAGTIQQQDADGVARYCLATHGDHDV